MEKLTAIILGYGMIGQAYAKYAVSQPDKLKIVALAEPEPSRRAYAKELHNIPDENLFDDWKKLAALPKWLILKSSVLRTRCTLSLLLNV